MRLHKSLVEAIIDALQEIFQNDRQASRVIENILKSNRQWGARDRAFIAENTYEIVRWWRLLLFAANIQEAMKPAHYWQVFGTWQILKPTHQQLELDTELPEWNEFSKLNPKLIFDRYQEGLLTRKIAQSIPDWLDEIGEQELGQLWNTELEASNHQAPLTLRVNTLKANIDGVREIFGGENTEIIPEVPTAIILKKRQNVFGQDGFKNGFFEVQDAGSQLIGDFLDVQPGHRVIDACAGAGGKTLHLAAMMQNKGRIISMDVEDYKLKELQKRARRNGVMNLEVKLIDSSKAIKRLNATADRLLLDVPCSGLGVLRRNPDAKWKLGLEFLDSVQKTQWEILSTYSQMLKRGGKMVYATCSLLPSESEDQVKKFITKFGSEWKLISERRTSIAKEGYDGFYMALLERL
jgi:16S rRNA (cytosine967-C5)-methyltransferase